MRRHKRWYRPRNVILAILAAGLLWLGWAVYFALTAKPGNTIDYAAKLNELARANQPGDIDAPNRWEEYAAVMEAVAAQEQEVLVQTPVSRTRTIKPSILSYEPHGFDTPQEIEEIRTLQKRAISFIQAVHSSSIPSQIDRVLESGAICWEMDPGAPLIQQSPPELSNARLLADCFTYEAWTALLEGRGDEAVIAVRRSLALARIYTNSPHTTAHITSLGMKAQLCELLIDACIKQQIEPEIARQLIQLLADFPTSSTERVFQAERLIALDLIQRVYSDDGHGDGTFLPYEVLRMGMPDLVDGPKSRLINIAGLFEADRRTTTRLLADVMSNLVRQSSMSPRDRKNDAFKLAHIIETEEFQSHKLLSNLVSWAFERVQRSTDQANMLIAAAQVLLAIEVERGVAGHCPESLHDLAPELRRMIPDDPYAPDGQFHYFTRSPTADDEREFILYSVGLDGVDNAGTPETRPWEATVPDGQGTDYIVNRDRRKTPPQDVHPDQ